MKDPITDYRDAVQRAKSKSRESSAMSRLLARAKMAKLIGWPALEQSFMDELRDCEEIARSKPGRSMPLGSTLEA